MKVLSWIGKTVVVLAAVIVIAAAVIALVNGGFVNRLIPAGRPPFGEGFPGREFDRQRLRAFEDAPRFEERAFGRDWERGFGERRISWGLGLLRIGSRVAVFALVTAAVFAIGYLLGRRKPQKTTSQPSSPTAPPAPPTESPPTDTA
ncbi:MAG: hypothetical protein AB1457_12645 [Chloroflexota bacterium]